MRKLLLFLTVALAPSLYAALPAPATWEVRGGLGVDTNGGCFIAGATGTDYSQQNAAQFSATNLATTATATVVTSATHSFVATDVGNCIHVTAGTGWTVGFYQIVSVATGQATLDRAPAAVSTSGGTWAIGGALATLQAAIGGMTSSNVIWASGTFTNTTSLLLSVAGPGIANTGAPANRLVGYGTTRGDNGRFTIQLSTTSGLTAISATTQGWIVSNVEVKCNSVANSTGIASTATLTNIRNVKVSGCLTAAINLGSTSGQLDYAEVTGNSGNYGVVIGNGATSTTVRITNSWIHDNTLNSAGLRMTSSGVVLSNIISNNPGAVVDGIQVTAGLTVFVLNNTIVANGRHGLWTNTTNYAADFFKNNVFASNGGFGFVGSTSDGRPADQDWDGNAYYNNTLGTRSFADDVAINPQSAGVYTNTHDVILTANPFTNPNGNDFSLNAVTGGGAAIRSVGVPGLLPGYTGQGYMDFGALQVQPNQNITVTACQTSGRAYAQ